MKIFIVKSGEYEENIESCWINEQLAKVRLKELEKAMIEACIVCYDIEDWE